MIGFKYFNEIFSNLSDENKKNILEKIFSIHNIIEYYYFKRDDLVFRIYADGVFYQFVFIFGNSKSSVFFQKKEEYRITCVYIYVFDYLNNRDNVSYRLFASILLSKSELEVYKLLSIFLWLV